MEKEYGDEVPMEEILAMAEESGIEREKAEEAIQKLNHEDYSDSISEITCGIERRTH